MAVASLSGDGTFLDKEVLLVPADGREVFTSLPLDSDARYAIDVRGVVPATCYGFFNPTRICSADAQHESDRFDNFVDKHSCLTISESPRLISGDRATHEYRFAVNGAGRRLAMKFTCAAPNPSGRVLFATISFNEHRLPAWLFGCGSTAATVLLSLYHPFPLSLMFLGASAALPTVVLWFARRIRQTLQEKVQEESNQEALERERERQEREDHEALAPFLVLEHAPQLEDLEHLAQRAERLMEDPGRRAALVATWNQSWSTITDALLKVYKNPRLLHLLKTNHPHLFERVLAAARVLEQAERRAASVPTAAPREKEAEVVPIVQPPASSETPEASRSKISVEEFQKRTVKRIEVAAEDVTLFELSRFQKRSEARTKFEEAGMPEDEIQGVLMTLDAAIRGALDRRKDGTDDVPGL